MARATAVTHALKQVKRSAALALILLLTVLAVPASAQSAPHRNTEWPNSGGMSLNSPGSDKNTLTLQGRGRTGRGSYQGSAEPPEWLFDNPNLANDPWHFLPMTRWSRINDFFSTGEGGLFSVFSGSLNSIYSTLISMAFTLASFTWVITSWLVRLMVGAPTLAAEYMGQVSDQFDRYSTAVIGTGWVWLLLILAVIVTAWRILRGASGKEAVSRVAGAAIPLSLILALSMFQTTVVDTNGETHHVRGPEWLFTTSLRLSSLVSEPLQELTDVFAFNEAQAPDQLVTCDAYTAVLEGNFIRAWNAGEKDNLDSDKFISSSGAFNNAPAAVVYDWAQRNDDLRMRLALVVSRIWERGYMVGYGNAQFGDTLTAERAMCLIADWRNRSVTPLEQLAVWRETCFLSAFQQDGDDGSLLLGENMALTGCALMPQIAEPNFTDPSRRVSNLVDPDDLKEFATNTLIQIDVSWLDNMPQNSPEAWRRFANACGAWGIFENTSDKDWYHTPNDLNRGKTGINDRIEGLQADCLTTWRNYLNKEQALKDYLVEHMVYSGQGGSVIQQIVAENHNLRAQVYAAALFNPSNHLIDGDRFAYRTMHGAFAACEFTDWQSNAYLQDEAAIASVNDRKVPLYPTHAAHLTRTEQGDTQVTTQVPAQAYIQNTVRGSSIRVDGRMWGLGFDGISSGGTGKQYEIITPNACLAYIFGSGNNKLDGDQDYNSSGTTVWTSDELGIHDKSRQAYKDDAEFRWDQDRYPHPNAWLDPYGGSQSEYPGANNIYARWRLGRTPEEYRDSASLWPNAIELQNVAVDDEVFTPTLSSSMSGGDVFTSIHGRNRGEMALMAIIAVIVGFAYLFSLSGLALGAALSIVILALLIMTLPISLLFAAAPFERAKELPKKLLKIGLGSAMSYAIFLFIIALVLLITDLILGVAVAVEVTSDEFWYTLLLGLAPWIGLMAVKMVATHLFQVNVTSFKGAMKLTSGMAFGDLGGGGGRSQIGRYARQGMRGFSYGPMMRGMQGARGASGAAMRSTPGMARTGAAAGLGAAAGAAIGSVAAGGVAAGAKGVGAVGKGAAAGVGGMATGAGAGLASAMGAGAGGGAMGGDGPTGGWRGRLSRVLAPREANRPPGRIKRAMNFARAHPAMVASAALFPIGGIGAAGGLYAAAKLSKFSGAGHMVRARMGMPMRMRSSSGESDLQWASGHVRNQRQRLADRLDPGSAAPVTDADAASVPAPAPAAAPTPDPAPAPTATAAPATDASTAGPAAMAAANAASAVRQQPQPQGQDGSGQRQSAASQNLRQGQGIPRGGSESLVNAQGERMVAVGPNGYLPQSTVNQAHASSPRCGAPTRTTGQPCQLPASCCGFHMAANRPPESASTPTDTSLSPVGKQHLRQAGAPPDARRQT